jgi:FOG: HEAT repeat
MKFLVRAATTAALATCLALGVSAQSATTTSSKSDSSAQKSGEKTVEEAYLQETAETMMVRELSHADDKDSKDVALGYIKKAIDAGRKSDEIRASLQYLALENTQVVTRSAGLGPSTNNYPDIRRQAVELLAEFPSEETKDTLVTVISNPKVEDPMVLAEAIRSLGKVGLNKDDEVVEAIANSVNHFSKVGMAEDRLAIYTCFAIQDLAEKNGGIKDMVTVTNLLMSFTKGSYISSVKKTAMATLDKLIGYSAKNSSGSKDSNGGTSTTSAKK